MGDKTYHHMLNDDEFLVNKDENDNDNTNDDNQE